MNNMVVVHDGSTLGQTILDTWNEKYGGVGPPTETADRRRSGTDGDAHTGAVPRTGAAPRTGADELPALRASSLAALEEHHPELVVLASDMPSEFEQVVLKRCRELKLSILTVLGRGSTVLVGPLEVPDVPGCATCLQLRWENTFSYSMNSIFGDPEERLEMSEADLATLGDIVADEIRSIAASPSIVGATSIAASRSTAGQPDPSSPSAPVSTPSPDAPPAPPHCQGKVGVYDLGEPIEWVPLVPSHDCPRCNLMPDDDPALAKVHFTSHVIQDVQALRVQPVDFRRLRTLYMHPKVGYVSTSNEVSSADPTGGQFVQADAYIYEPDGLDIAGYGSGANNTEARQSALLEVLERSCGVQAAGRRSVVRGSFSELAETAVHPSQLGLHRDSLYQVNHDLEPFDEEKRHSWVWAYSTKHDKSVLIPEQMSYYGPTSDDKRFVTETSNGCAIGGTVEEAVLHGIFEVLERDGFLNMWYGKMPVPELVLGEGCPPQTSEVVRYLKKNGFRVRLFSLSHDLNIPCICAVAIRRKKGYPSVVSGSACHLQPYQAVDGALREVTVQVMNLERASEEKRQGALPMLRESTKIKHILDHVAVAALPEASPRWEFLLRQDHTRKKQSVAEAYAGVERQYPIHTRDIRQVLTSVLEDIHSRGFDVIVLDQTSVEVAYGGLHAVKVLIPGMTPITFGYGFERVKGLRRVFELPYRLGYSPGILTEQDLNPDCHPFS